MRAVDLHAGLTVVEATPGDAGPLVRALVGSLACEEDGVHVEFTRDDGSFLVAFRPIGAAHRVVDVVTHRDATGTYAGRDGSIDLLATWRATPRVLERDIVAGAEDLQQEDPTVQWVARLSANDVEQLISAAQAEVAAEEELRRATESARALPDEAEVARLLKEARERADLAERRHNRSRVATLAVGTTVPVAAVVGLNTIGAGGAIGLLAGTMAVTVGCFIYGRRYERAINEESATVARLKGPSTGIDGTASTGTGVPDAGVVDETVRTTLLTAAERYHGTAQTWQDLAGTVPAPWVLAEADRLRRAAALRAEVGLPHPVQSDSLMAAPASTALMAGLADRAASTRAITGDADPLPLFLEDPLHGLEWAEKAPVLEFLGRLAARQQIILVTADQEVLAWARLEAMTGGVAVAGIASGEPGVAKGAPGEVHEDKLADGS
jgi:hypothetical protein